MSKNRGRDKRKQRLKAKQRRERKLEASEGIAALGAKMPLERCLISESWQHWRNMTQIAIGRQAKRDRPIILAVFMIDLACLGLKDGFVRKVSTTQCEQVLEQISRNGALVPCDPDLAAKVIEEAERYARDLGFEPEADSAAAKAILGDADPARCDADVPLGGEAGRPYYFIGPHDDPGQIISRLLQRCGDDGFTVAGPPALIPDPVYHRIEQHPNVQIIAMDMPRP